jgi:hypothetical protein
MSMSTGDITVQGNRAHYELRMPLYEIAHVKVPEAALFTAVRFSTREGQAAYRAELFKVATGVDIAGVCTSCQAPLTGAPNSSTTVASSVPVGGGLLPPPSPPPPPPPHATSIAQQAASIAACVSIRERLSTVARRRRTDRIFEVTL